MSDNQNDRAVTGNIGDSQSATEPEQQGQPWQLAQLAEAFVRRPGARGGISRIEIAEMQKRATKILEALMAESAGQQELIRYWRDRYTSYSANAEANNLSGQLDRIVGAMPILAQIIGIAPRSADGRSMVKRVSSDPREMTIKIEIGRFAWLVFSIEREVVDLYEVVAGSREEKLRLTVYVQGSRLTESDLDGLRAKLAAVGAEHLSDRMPARRGLGALSSVSQAYILGIVMGGGLPAVDAKSYDPLPMG